MRRTVLITRRVPIEEIERLYHPRRWHLGAKGVLSVCLLLAHTFSEEKVLPPDFYEFSAQLNHQKAIDEDIRRRRFVWASLILEAPSE